MSGCLITGQLLTRPVRRLALGRIILLYMK